MGKTNEKNNRNNHSNVKIATKPPIFANANETKRYVDRLKTDIFCVLLTKTIWQMYNITQLILKWTFYGYARTAQEKAVGREGGICEVQQKIFYRLQIILLFIQTLKFMVYRWHTSLIKKNSQDELNSETEYCYVLEIYFCCHRRNRWNRNCLI